MSIRPTIDTLRELHVEAPDGHHSMEFFDALDEYYNKLIRQIQATNGKGRLTVTLEINPVRGDASTVTIDPSIAIAPPKKKPISALFYTTPEGNTTTRNPRQKDAFAVKRVPDENGDPIEVDTSTGEIRNVSE